MKKLNPLVQILKDENNTLCGFDYRLSNVFDNNIILNFAVKKSQAFYVRWFPFGRWNTQTSLF